MDGGIFPAQFVSQIIQFSSIPLSPDFTFLIRFYLLSLFSWVDKDISAKTKKRIPRDNLRSTKNTFHIFMNLLPCLFMNNVYSNILNEVFIGIFYILHGLVHLLYMGHSLNYFELEKGFIWSDSKLLSKIISLRTKKLFASALCVVVSISAFDLSSDKESLIRYTTSGG